MTAFQFARSFDDEAQILNEAGDVVAEMDDDRITAGDRLVWRAAVVVLVPDEEVVLAVAAAIHKEGCDECVLRARAALAALRDRAVSQS